MKLRTLRKRREFLRIRGGGRWSNQAFVLETKQRAADTGSAEPQETGPRFGFTVTKRLGNAVRRNRIRRRLKAALSQVAQSHAKDHFDYVLIARQPAHDMAFTELIKLLVTAFDRVHQPKSKSGRKRKPNTNSDATKQQPQPRTGLTTDQPNK
jgi:ribonuclease P protein component